MNVLRWDGTGRWPLMLVLLLAAVLRLWQLGEVPPGFQFDEAHNAIDAARVLDGQFALFFPDNGGREPLLTYLHAPFLAWLGRDQAVVALRLVSALIGVVTVVMVYQAAAALFGDRRLALLAAAFLTVSYWHLHFSRYGIRAILAPLWASAAIWAWWRAVAGSAAPPGARGARGWGFGWAVAAGGFLAAAVYSHPSGRLLPLVLIGHATYRALADRQVAARTWRALAVSGVVAFVLFLPLGAFFVQHPGLFTAHPSDVSLVAVAEAQHGGSTVAALASQLWAVAGMFFLAGDPSTFHNLPGLPVFDPLSGLAAVLGFGVVLGTLVGGSRPQRERAVLLIVWLLVMLAPTALSDRPPNYSRAMAALPVIVLLPAIGLIWLLDARPSRPHWARAALATAVVIAAGLWTSWHYFVLFANRTPHVYYSYDVDKQDAYAALVELADEAEVFLHPLWARHATIAYLNADGPVRELDATDTLVQPADARTSGRDVVVAFPAEEAEREGWLARAESLYGAVAQRQDVADAAGRPLLVTYRVSAAALGDLDVPTDAPLEPAVWTMQDFSGMIRLVGYSVGPPEPGSPLAVTFVWQAIEPVTGDFTAFIHLVAADGTTLGQEDREPGRATYRTSAWQSGDVIIDRYWPLLPEPARGRLELQVGWYDLATDRRLFVGSGEETMFRLKPLDVGP